MKHLFIVLLFLSFYISNIHAQTTLTAGDAGYEIETQILPYKNTKMYLGSYYGKNKVLVDSTLFNEDAKGVFKGDKKLPPGIYFFVTPSHSLLFEILMDKEQHFSIFADSANPQKIKVEGSVDNEIFAGYSKFLAGITPQIIDWKNKAQTASTESDKKAAKEKVMALSEAMTAYRENVITHHPESMMAAFFNAVKTPEIKATPHLANGAIDSVAMWNYMKDHFWDEVDFSNNSLIRTPFFDPKLNDYFKYYVSPEPDSIIKEVNYMLLASRSGKDIHQYLLGKFTDKYINPEIMGQDKVFLFLFNNYYSKGDTSWLNDRQKKYIFDRAYSIMANQINEPAPPLTLKDTTGKNFSLYDINAPFTFLVFWDPTCGHCKTEIPLIDSIYRAKWKNEGVVVIGVNTNDNTFDEWKRFITEHHLNGWHHLWQPKKEKEADELAQRPNFRQLYDVVQTPTMYLLDKDKRIIAKKLDILQYDALIDAHKK